MVFLEGENSSFSGTEPSRLRLKPIGQPAATFGEEFEANRNYYVDSWAGRDRAYYDTFEDHIKSLRSLGINDPLVNPERHYQNEPNFIRLESAGARGRDHWHREYSRKLDELAVKYPDLADKIRPAETFDALAAKKVRDELKRKEEIAERSQGGLRWGLAAVLGGAWSMATDPYEAPTMLLGTTTAGRSLLYHFVQNAAINAGTEALRQPEVQRWRKDAGADYGLMMALEQIGMAGLVGGAIDPAVRAAARSWRVLGGLPAVKAGHQVDASTPGWRGVYEGGQPLPDRATFAKRLDEAAQKLPEGDPVRKAFEGDDRELADVLYKARNQIADPETRARIDEAIANADMQRTLKAFGIPDDWTTAETMARVFRHIADPSQPLPTGRSGQAVTQTYVDHLEARVSELEATAQARVRAGEVPMRAGAKIAELVPDKALHTVLIDDIKEAGASSASEIDALIRARIENHEAGVQPFVSGNSTHHLHNVESLATAIGDNLDLAAKVSEGLKQFPGIAKALADPDTEAAKILAKAIRDGKVDEFPARLQEAIVRDGAQSVLERRDVPLGRPDFDTPAKGAAKQVEAIEAPVRQKLEEVAHAQRMEQVRAAHPPEPPANYIRDWEVDSVVEMWRFVQEMRRVPEPERLASFLKRNGGLREDAGELRQVKGEYKQRPGLVSKGGLDLDRATQMAWDAGYLDGSSRPQIAALLDALSDDLGAQPRYSSKDIGVVEDIRIAREMERDLDGYGLTPANSKTEPDVRRQIARFNDEIARNGGLAGDQARARGEEIEPGRWSDPEFAASAGSAREARDLILAGRSVQIADDLADAVLYHGRDAFNAIPDGHFGGVLYRIDNHPDNRDAIILTFQLASGKRVRIATLLDEWFADGGNIRAVHFTTGTGKSLIGVVRYQGLGSGVPEVRVRGEIYHEVTHLLRKQGLLIEPDFVALAGHAESLRVLDMTFRDLHQAMGLPPTSDIRTLRQAYTSIYSRYGDAELQERLAQEAVAHFVELAQHGYWLKAELDPVRHIVDHITSGRYGGKNIRSEARLAQRQNAFAIGGRDRELDSLGYYSKALEAAKAWPQGKGTPEQALAWLKKSGVKDAEIEATGVGNAFAGQKSITRDDLVKHLTENRARLTESKYLPHSAASQMTNDDLRPTAGGTRFSNFTLDPDNPTYRETVLHLPEITQGTEALARYGRPYVQLNPREQAQARTDIRKKTFTSGHFDEPNIVGHTQSSMVKHDGKLTYLIDQIQSDWGQRLRDKGARDEAKIADLRDRFGSMKDAWNNDPGVLAVADRAQKLLNDVYPLGHADGDKFHDVWHGLAILARDSRVPTTEQRELASELRLQKVSIDASYDPDMARLRSELNTATSAVSGHPLVNTTDQWTNTVLRRSVRQAIEDGAEYIAIPHGDTVLSYNPGDADGMRGFYGSRASEGILPKNLRKSLEKIDPDAKPIKVEKVETTKGMEGWKGESRGGKPSHGADAAQTGFTVFPLTEKIKRSFLDEGQPMFAIAGRDDHYNTRTAFDEASDDAWRHMDGVTKDPNYFEWTEQKKLVSGLKRPPEKSYAEVESNRLLSAVREFEDALTKSGASPQDVAAAMQSHFGFAVDPNPDLWWWRASALKSTAVPDARQSPAKRSVGFDLSADQRDIAKSMYANGMAVGDITNHLSTTSDRYVSAGAVAQVVGADARARIVSGGLVQFNAERRANIDALTAKLRTEPYLTMRTGDVADALGIPRDVVYRARKEGRLASNRVVAPNIADLLMLPEVQVLSTSNAARVLGASIGNVQRTRNKLGLKGSTKDLIGGRQSRASEAELAAATEAIEAFRSSPQKPQYALASTEDRAGDILVDLRNAISRSDADTMASEILKLCKAA